MSDAERAAHIVSTFYPGAGQLKDTTGNVIAARDRARARARREPCRPHVIVASGGGLRCKTCGKQAKTQKGRKRFGRAECSGFPTGVRRRIHGKQPKRALYEGSRGLGHDLWKNDELGIVWCHTCGGYSSQRAHLLAQHCRGKFSAGSRLRRNRLARGCDPTCPATAIGESRRLKGADARAFLVGIQARLD